MADTKQATHGFKPSIHAKTCPEFHQKANAGNDGCVQDSAFPCNCGADKFAASRSGPDRTTQDDEDRRMNNGKLPQWHFEVSESPVKAGPDRGQQDAPDDEWEAVAGHELDDWGIRRKGEEDGMSVAQMLWERDAKYVVALHNRAKAAREGQAPKGDRIKVEREPGCKCEYAIWTNAKGCPLHGHGNLGVREIV